VIRLTGIRASGRHGANPGERDQAQEFVVDLKVTAEVQGDSLEGTVDYRTLATTATDAVSRGSFVLLETLAGAVADAVGALPGVRRATATVHKPGAARSIGIDDVSATATVP
jgi:dihydroneopterin aldolase/2-amino-4-hydroxy-6-hydroxymethyldihydropteridine diphosphokinase